MSVWSGPVRLVLVTCLALAGLMSGLVLGSSLSQRSEGRAVVLIRPLAGNAFADREGNSLVDLETDAQTALSDAVLGRVAEERGSGTTVVGLRRRLSVSVVRNAEVVAIRFRGANGLEAAAVAGQVAEAMLAVRAENGTAAVKNQAALLQADLTVAEDQFVAEQEKDPEAVLLPVLSERIVSLRNQLRDASGSVVDPGSVLATTVPRQGSARPLRWGLGLAGLLLGASVGAGLSWRLRRRAPRAPSEPVEDAQLAAAGAR